MQEMVFRALAALEAALTSLDAQDWALWVQSVAGVYATYVVLAGTGSFARRGWRVAKAAYGGAVWTWGKATVWWRTPSKKTQMEAEIRRIAQRIDELMAPTTMVSAPSQVLRGRG